MFLHHLTRRSRALSNQPLSLRLKGPPYNIRGQYLGFLDLLGSRFELLHIPIAPDEFPVQELGFGARHPEDEMRGEFDCGTLSANRKQKNPEIFTERRVYRRVKPKIDQKNSHTHHRPVP